MSFQTEECSMRRAFFTGQVDSWPEFHNPSSQSGSSNWISRLWVSTIIFGALTRSLTCLLFLAVYYQNVMCDFFSTTKSSFSPLRVSWKTSLLLLRTCRSWFSCLAVWTLMEDTKTKILWIRGLISSSLALLSVIDQSKYQNLEMKQYISLSKY